MVDGVGQIYERLISFYNVINVVNFLLTNWNNMQVRLTFLKLLIIIKSIIFGDVPWLTRDLNVDSEELYAPRNSRAEVMDSLLMCINKSVAGLPQKGKEESGRLNKDMANFLKARICLFERYLS